MATNKSSSYSNPPQAPLASPQSPKEDNKITTTQDDDEFNSFIATLPKEQSWSSMPSSHVYQYQGFWYPSWFLKGAITTQRHFQARNTDIILTTTPKCGTTWLKALTYAVVNRNKHPLSGGGSGGTTHPLLTHNPHDLVPYLELNLFGDLKVTDPTKLPSPRVLSTHLPAVSLPVSTLHTGCKMVYIGREPKDAFISMWHFSNKFRQPNEGNFSLEKAFDMFCDGVSFYGPFWDHVLTYWKYSLESPNKVLFLKFEDLKKEPELYLKKLAEFLGYPFSLEEENDGVVQDIIKLCSFDNLSNLGVNKNGKLFSRSTTQNNGFFRRGQVGDWANYFTSDMVEKFDQISHEKFHPYGLKF